MTLPIIILALALLVVVAGAYLSINKESKKLQSLGEEHRICQSRLQEAEARATELAIRERTATETLAQAHKTLETKELMIRDLIEQRAKAVKEVESLIENSKVDREKTEKLQQTFRDEFKVMATDILEQKGKQLRDVNRESMETIIKPFKDDISQFKTRVEQIYSEENQQRGALKNELKNLLDLNKRITEETTNLTNALKGNSKVQGDWGEMILETILESSQLINGIHYTTQQSFTDEQGDRQRPDVVLNLPDNKQVIIDSKVSLTAFVGYANAKTNDERERYIADHLTSVKKHVDELGSKRYQNLVNSPDFVIMFIPNEPAFLAALQSDPSIWSSAYHKKVIISSPTNLFALLKIVDDLWKRDNQSRNAIEIADQGARLYDKFVGLLDSVTDLGKSIDNTSRNYEKVVNQLKTGSGNLVGRTEKLRKLGLKTLKTLPTQFENYEHDEDTEDESDETNPLS